MAPKAEFLMIKVSNLTAPQAVIVKECMLSAGGDAAIHQGCIGGHAEPSDALLFSTRGQLLRALEGLRRYGGELTKLAADISAALGYANAPPKLPVASDVCSQALVRLFNAMKERTVVMGILNVTPNSFSDGGQFKSVDDAVRFGLRMAAEGADIIDVGGESTRPGAQPVSVDDEMERVLPVIRKLSDTVEVPISIDTSKPDVAEYALVAGASIINDITACRLHPDLAHVAAGHQAPLVLMHMKGDPQSMQDNPQYDDLVGEIYAFLRQQMLFAMGQGVPEELIILDPGFGFGKTPEQNLELLRRLGEFRSLGRPVMIGTSRKSTLGKVVGAPSPADRLEATAASVALSIANGASIVRVHDVRQMVRVARMTDAVVHVGASS